jgi:phosphonate transport system permease protein
VRDTAGAPPPSPRDAQGTAPPPSPYAWKRRTSAAALRLWLVRLLVLSLALTALRFIASRTEWSFVLDAPEQAADLGARMVPPRWSYLGSLLRPLWETINLATLGTLLGVLMAAPLAILAAHNTTPSRPLVRPVALALLVASRSVNTLIWALVMVVVLGPGPLAGILAVAFRSVGFVGKLVMEAIEESDRAPVEAIASTGASRPQVLVYAIVPQVMPTFAGVSVYRWDINIREATVLGLVGAGGIGMALQASINTLAWNQVSVIFLAILSTVLCSEWVSARVRGALR